MSVASTTAQAPVLSVRDLRVAFEDWRGSLVAIDGVSFDIAAGEYWPKPHPQINESLVKKHGIDPTRAAFADDISVNLKPAADIGMRTVWIRTDESVKRAADADLSHIHHQTDDLATWLDDWLTERNLKT